MATASLPSLQLLTDNTRYFGVATAVVYAGFWRRLNAAIIDAIVVSLVIFVVNILVAVIVGYVSNGPPSIGFWVSIGVGITYYVGFESSRGQATIGKRALGITVTDLYGNRISIWRALVRYFAKLLSLLTLLIGYVMAGFTQKKQALHDMIAGTLVVVSR